MIIIPNESYNQLYKYDYCVLMPPITRTNDTYNRW